MKLEFKLAATDDAGLLVDLYRMDRFPTVLACETVSMRTVALVAECGQIYPVFHFH